MLTQLTRLSILVLALLVSASSWASSFPDKYDDDFKKYAGIYLPGVDWKLLKAQCYQESLLNPTAVSYVGAMGLCQFMPGTWKQVSRQLKLPKEINAFVPEYSIMASAYYMMGLRKSWSWERPEHDRHSLAMASYNAGLGNLLKAQKKCGYAKLYNDIIACLPRVTGRHSKETITYVRRIWGFWRRMMLGN